MSLTFLNPAMLLALLMSVLTSGVRDLASCISTEYYWKAKNVSVSVEQLTHELDVVPAADVSKFVADLDADDPKVRDEATAKISALGPAAIPGLEDAAKNGSPEVVARANGLLAKIHAQSKESSVRRLMAIRTLGERKEASALPTLRKLSESKELFEAEYAGAAIAKIEGKPHSMPVAGLADREADVALMPAKLDAVAQVAPQLDGTFSIEKMIEPFPMPADQKAKSIEEANAQILKLLDELGNVRLDAITLGFYAAPPGVPGNAVGIVRGEFDPVALAAVLGKVIPKSKKVDGMDVFESDDDTVLLIASGKRVMFFTREAGGDLGLDAMIAALKKGKGDFADNQDLPQLVKGIDTKAPFWVAARIATGMKEIVGPLGDFDNATIVARQSNDHDNVVTEFHLEAQSNDAAKAKQAVETVQAQLKQAVEEGRQQEKAMPVMKPLVDFVASIKLNADGGKATLDGSMAGTAMSSMLGGFGSMRVQERAVPAPAPVGKPAEQDKK